MTALLLPLHLGLHGSGPVTLVLLGCGVAALLVLACCYLCGLVRVLRHPGRRRHLLRALALAAAAVSVLVVTLPPLGEVLEERLSTHMVQHLVLIMVAAPLLAVAAPGQVLLAGAPPRLRRGVVSRLHRTPSLGLLTPHVAWVAHLGALWLWHLPASYDAAVRSPVVHVLEHATFLLTAWLFWWHLATVTRRRLRGPAAAAYVAAAIPPGAALGAVLTFPDHPLYPDQARAAAASGIDPLLDQRIGGLVMWIPLDFAYLALAIWLFGRWLARLTPATDSPDLPDLPADARPVAPAPVEAAR